MSEKNVWKGVFLSFLVGCLGGVGPSFSASKVGVKVGMILLAGVYAAIFSYRFRRRAASLNTKKAWILNSLVLGALISFFTAATEIFVIAILENPATFFNEFLKIGNILVALWIGLFGIFAGIVTLIIPAGGFTLLYISKKYLSDSIEIKT